MGSRNQSKRIIAFALIILPLVLCTLCLSLSAKDNKPIANSPRIVFESPRWWTAGRMYYENGFIRAYLETARHRPFSADIKILIDGEWKKAFTCSPYASFTSRAKEKRETLRLKNGEFVFQSSRESPPKWGHQYWGTKGSIVFHGTRGRISLLNNIALKEKVGKISIPTFTFTFKRSPATFLSVEKDGKTLKISLTKPISVDADSFSINIVDGCSAKFLLNRKLSSQILADAKTDFFIRPDAKTVKVTMRLKLTTETNSNAIAVAGDIILTCAENKKN